LKDHLLLNLVEEQFEVFVTIDRGFEHQHNLKNCQIGIVIVHVSRNKAASYRALAAELLSSVVEVRPGGCCTFLAFEKSAHLVLRAAPFHRFSRGYLSRSPTRVLRGSPRSNWNPSTVRWNHVMVR
jgi:hypothetical protein